MQLNPFRRLVRLLWSRKMDLCELALDRGCNPSRRTWSGYAADYDANLTLRELGPGGDVFGLGCNAPWALCINSVTLLAAMYEREGSFGRPNFLAGMELRDERRKLTCEVRSNGQVILTREEFVDAADYQETYAPGTVHLLPTPAGLGSD